MKLQSSPTDQPCAHGSGTDWQVVGELDLPDGLEAHTLIKAWLVDVLTPIHLPVDVRDRIGKLAREAAGRGWRAETVSAVQRPRLRLCIPARCPADAPAWGFFCLDRAETAAAPDHPGGRLIEFYLFPEGQ